MPFLIAEDGHKIWESNAILIFLCEKYCEKLGQFYGHTAENRAKTNQIMSWYQSYYRPALFGQILLKEYGMKKKGIPFTAQ